LKLLRGVKMISIETAKRIYLAGLKEKYPVCCIEQFIIDCNNDKYPALNRVDICGYVPCQRCQEKLFAHIDERLIELLNEDDNTL